MTRALRQQERSLRAHAVALGESGSADAVGELLALTRHGSAQVRRLTTSALGKLAAVAHGSKVLPALAERLRDPHPQVRQYAVRAIAAYGATAEGRLPDLQDVADRPTETDYNRRDAASALDTIRSAIRLAREEALLPCQRCSRTVTADEYARALRAFQRPDCDKCFNEVSLRRRNFDPQVELNKTLPASDGRWVQSDDERLIANFLTEQGLAYRYDERLQIIDGSAIRPDFYLPELDLYLEYWGMDTIDYKIGMLKKQKLYQQQGKRLVSVGFRDKPRLREVLAEKLARYVRLPAPDSASLRDGSAPRSGRSGHEAERSAPKELTHKETR